MADTTFDKPTLLHRGTVTILVVVVVDSIEVFSPSTMALLLVYYAASAVNDDLRRLM